MIIAKKRYEMSTRTNTARTARAVNDWKNDKAAVVINMVLYTSRHGGRIPFPRITFLQLQNVTGSLIIVLIRIAKMTIISMMWLRYLRKPLSFYYEEYKYKYSQKPILRFVEIMGSALRTYIINSIHL
jgi:hypothetical protein